MQRRQFLRFSALFATLGPLSFGLQAHQNQITPISYSRAEWRQRLSPSQFNILRIFIGCCSEQAMDWHRVIRPRTQGGIEKNRICYAQILQGISVVSARPLYRRGSGLMQTQVKYQFLNHRKKQTESN